MKSPAVAVISLLVAGCVSTGAVAPNASGDNAATPVITPDPMPPIIWSPAIPATQPNNLAPQIITPVTGGAPVMAIPLGGSIFQPVTGGRPFWESPPRPDSCICRWTRCPGAAGLTAFAA
jgi:hypothetical protein